MNRKRRKQNVFIILKVASTYIIWKEAQPAIRNKKPITGLVLHAVIMEYLISTASHIWFEIFVYTKSNATLEVFLRD